MSRSSGSPIYRITSARKSVADDQATRVRGYVISMSIRIACFVLAIAAHGILRWVCVAGALIIPYLAVVYANGGREPNQDAPDTLVKGAGRALDAGHKD
ncbi:MAG TPA: DUF3099 domain-containing protein [Actinomycetes bacterium]|nr:DUF3099 domain-containing protein [Actinomycetes bacterium]